MTSASNQLDAEMQWLATRKNIYPMVVQRVEAVLRCPELAMALGVLEKCNRTRERPFLLGLHIFQVVHSVDERERSIKGMPILERRPAEIRAHFQTTSKKSRILAKQLRIGPQPKIALSGSQRAFDFEEIFAFGIIEAPKEETAYIPLSDLLDRAATLLDLIAKRRVMPADQHRRPAKDRDEAKRRDLRRRAMRFLTNAFREALGHPYHEHVAAIATVLSGIETSSDDVKKVDRRTFIRAVKGRKRS